MSAGGLTARGVPPFPPWLLFVKFAILGLNLVVLALAAYAVSILGGGVGAYIIFVTIKTFFIIGGSLAIELWAPRLFIRILILIACGISLVFWLGAWAWAASGAGLWLSWSVSGWAKAEGGALAGCAALGAVIWVLSILNLVVSIKACLADRNTAAQPHQTELGQPKYDQNTASTMPPPGGPGYYQDPYAQPGQPPAQQYNVQYYQQQQQQQTYA